MPTSSPTFNRVRVAGSGFTIFAFAGQPITFAQQVSEVSPTPVGPGPVAIQPIDEPYPIQVITPAASGMGSITLNLYEIYNEKVWDRLASNIETSNTGGPFGGLNSNQVNTSSGIFNGAVDLVDVFIRQAEYAGELTCTKFIRPPLLNGTAGTAYYDQYHGCVITDIKDGETIEVGSMEILKQITVAYRFKTRNGQSSKAFQYRNAALPAAS